MSGGEAEVIVGSESVGSETVGSGATLLEPTVGKGVRSTVNSGGTARDTTINGGIESVRAGGTAAGTTTFGTNATLALYATTPTATVSKFRAFNEVDLKAFKFSTTEKLSFVENAANTRGVLTVTDGAHKAKITMFGYYTAAGFTLSPAAGGGTAITTNFAPPNSFANTLAANHH